MPDFFLPMVPPTVTAQQKGERVTNGRIQHYKKTELVLAEDMFITKLRPFHPDKPLDCPVELYVRFSFPTSKSRKDGEWKTTRPDTDNLQKLFKDCMAKAGFFTDDARVCSETVEKVYSDTPGIYVYYDRLKE